MYIQQESRMRLCMQKFYFVIFFFTMQNVMCSEVLVLLVSQINEFIAMDNFIFWKKEIQNKKSPNVFGL